MGRNTGTNASISMSKSQDAAGAAQSGAAIKAQDKGVSDFRGAINKEFMDKNRWLDPSRLADVRNVASSIASGSQNASEGENADYQLRTGTLNGATSQARMAEGRRKTMRDLEDYLAKDRIDAYDKDYEAKKFGTAALGEIPKIYASNYGTATGLRSSAGGDLSKVGAAQASQPSIWQSILGAAGQVGAAAVTKF
jgi:hypothetical protein